MFVYRGFLFPQQALEYPTPSRSSGIDKTGGTKTEARYHRKLPYKCRAIRIERRIPAWLRRRVATCCCGIRALHKRDKIRARDNFCSEG